METMQERLARIMAEKRKLSGDDAIAVDEQLKKISALGSKNNTVAIIESHRKHGEVYPAVIKYFLDLGYNVHLFHLQDHKKEDSLCRAEFDAAKFQDFVFPRMPENEEFFEILRQYKCIFVMTMFTHDGYNFVNALEKNYIQKYNLNNVFCIDHDFVSLQKNMDSVEQRFLDAGRIFVLRDGINYKNNVLPYVSPTFFGRYKATPKNDKTNFICVGGGWQNNLRNFKLLFAAINSLIEKGNVNFKVTFVGATQSMLEEFITPQNKDFLDIRGFAPFAELYDCMENSDFILFNIDDSCNEYEKYLHLGITGSYSLALGFAKPAIMFTPLISAYGMQNAAIAYEKENLTEAMLKAIELPANDYELLQSNMAKLNDLCMQLSVKNLNKIVMV